MLIKGSQKLEDTRQIRAFEHFVRLKRAKSAETFRLIAKESKVHPDSIRRWYKKFKWESRPDETVQEVAPTTAESLLALIDALLEKAQVDIKKGKLKPRNPKDVETLVKVRQLLLGKPASEETHVTVITGTPRPEKSFNEPFEQNELLEEK